MGGTPAAAAAEGLPPALHLVLPSPEVQNQVQHVGDNCGERARGAHCGSWGREEPNVKAQGAGVDPHGTTAETGAPRVGVLTAGEAESE